LNRDFRQRRTTMLDASNGSRPGDDHPPHTEHADATEAPAAERRGFGETHEEPASGTARPEAVTLVSIRKIEANRRNAQHSTGPRTDAGKRASRMNALKHGLLANEVVITRGDYKEDEEAFTQLLRELREQFTPVGPASRVVEKLVRYETSNDRELDRALKRLERMQERRRATEGTHPTN
jgi:hypothetical protein